jgi:hypothetical protein
MSRRLSLSSQVLIGSIDPIGARRIENVEIHGVFERLGLVRHIRGNAENFSGVDHNLLAVNPKLQRPVENVCKLFVVVAVLGNNAPFLKKHSREHNFLTDYKLPLQQRVQIFERNRVPGNELQLRLSGSMLGNGAMSPGMGFHVLGFSTGRNFGLHFSCH